MRFHVIYSDGSTASLNAPNPKSFIKALARAIAKGFVVSYSVEVTA